MDDDDKENVPPRVSQPDLILTSVLGLAPSLAPSLAPGSPITRQQPLRQPARARETKRDRAAFEERKKTFEAALLAWHAQDEEEDFGTSLYARHRQGGAPVSASSSDLLEQARLAWRGPVNAF